MGHFKKKIIKQIPIDNLPFFKNPKTIVNSYGS
jgi:hypothetical protein